MQFVLVIVTNLNLASVNLLCTLFNLLCTLYCICMLRYLACLFLVYPFRKKGGQLYIKVIKNQCIKFSSFSLFIVRKFVAVIYCEKLEKNSLCFPEFYAAKKQAMNRAIFMAGPEINNPQQSTSQHVVGICHISAGWGLLLLQMGLQHRHNEHCWSLERRASAGHPSSLLPLHRWRENQISPANPEHLPE